MSTRTPRKARRVVSLPTDLLTLQEVADNARVSVRTVKRWTSDGRLPVVVLGASTVRVRASDLLAFYDAHTVRREA